FREVRGSPTEVEPVGRARDPETGRRLWEVSEELTGVAYLSEPVAA
ncbi:MAG: short-chain dehydrogenase, partial [Solirubrobacterales bacterium]